MHVDVRLFPNGHLTTSKPEYESRWSVRAEPDGRIEGTDGYLFYEAQVPLVKPHAGWCVAVDNLQDFSVRVLTAYGFNDREISDFLDYWLPILNEAPFYEIRPLVNEQLDFTCPIDILPKPDNLLRLWLLFTPVNSRSSLAEPQIPLFSRNGFVATEWGGAIVP